jgi:hypothetical protein
VLKVVQHWKYHNTRLQIILQAIVTKTAWCWHKNRHKDQWNLIEAPEIKPHNSHLIFDQGVKNIHWKKKTVSSKDGVEKTHYLHATETRPLSLTLYKNQFQMGQRP